MSRPRILVISFSHLGRDPRVQRQLKLLRDFAAVTAVGYGDPGLDGVEFVLARSQPKTWPQRLVALWRLQTRQFQAYYDNIGYIAMVRAALAGRSFELILANDPEAWPLAAAIRGPARLIFDAHEFAPSEYDEQWSWRILYKQYKTDLCARYLPQADAMLTVCDGIAQEYRQRFGVSPHVVRNIPPESGLRPTPVPADRLRMIHHGGAARVRRIDDMIRLLDLLDDRFTLDLMLIPSDPDYLRQLQGLAASRPRVRFVAPVPMPGIAAAINDYDIGLYILPPSSLNHQLALPNKLFEFIQARLAVAIGPSGEMARIVTSHGCGVVGRSFSLPDMAAALGALTAGDVTRYKEAADRAATELCWEVEGRVIRDEVQRLLALGPRTDSQ